jgi:hypothetical protein
VRFSFKADDQDLPRRWKIFTGDPAFKVQYQCRVRVIVKGSIFTKGMEWIGPWNQGLGNGPLMVSVPTADDPSVTRKMLAEDMAAAPAGALPPPPPTAVPARPGARPGVAGPPPATRAEKAAGKVSGYSLTESKTAAGARTASTVPATAPPKAKARAGRTNGDSEKAAGKLELTASFHRR